MSTQTIQTVVEKRSNLSYADFAREYLFASRPVVLEDGAAQWSAMKKWNPDFFKINFPDRVLSADGKSFTASDYIDILSASTERDPAPYMHNQNIAEVFPELTADVSPTPAYFQPNWLNDKYFPPKLDAIMRKNSVVELYIGGPGGVFPVIHYDSIYTHAFLTQIYGEKELFLWAPDQAPYMYARRRNNVSDVNDAVNPDLDRFPLFAKAKGSSLILRPGQTIFIPGGWWHTARMLSQSITVSVNVANSSNWTEVTRDIVQDQNGPAKAALSFYLTILGSFKAKGQTPAI